MARQPQAHTEPQAHVENVDADVKTNDIDPHTGEVYATPDDDEINNEQEDTVEYLTKITVANIGGNPGAAKSTQQRVPVCVIMGRVVDTKFVEDPKGHPHPEEDGARGFIALVGAFHAINLQTDKEYKSGYCYLHTAFQQPIVVALHEQMNGRQVRGSKAFRGVDFSFQIDAKPAPNPSGYTYVLRSLLPPHKSDPLAAIRGRSLSMISLRHEPADAMLVKSAE